VVSVRTPQTVSGDAAMFLQIHILLFSKRSIAGTLSCDFQIFICNIRRLNGGKRADSYKKGSAFSMESFFTAAIDSILLRV
jgi:hypothetical protein